MRRVYLVRHGEPAAAVGNKKLCLGRKDSPLSPEGENQAARLAAYFKDKELQGIFSSPLLRCRRTAEIVAERSGHRDPGIEFRDGLMEADMGLWDGLEFEEIRVRYPEEYEKRGRDLLGFAIPGGESLGDAGRRYAAAIEEILKETDGDILICAHAGVTRAMLCQMSSEYMARMMEFSIPYASVTMLEGNDTDALAGLRIVTAGWRPAESLSLSEAERMWAECGATAEMRRHMERVAETAMDLIGYDRSMARSDRFDPAYPFRGTKINTRVLYYAALLHDVMRTSGGKVHAREGAEYLKNQGYQELYEPVLLHHEPSVLRPENAVSEAEILYYADKLVQGDRLVTLQQRFDRSLSRCTTPEALKNHQERYEAALAIEKKIMG